MQTEELLKKWISDELSPEEMTVFKLSEDYNEYTDIVEGAKYFKAPDVTIENSEAFFNKHIKNKEEVKVVKLRWIKPALQIASVFIAATMLYFSLSPAKLTRIESMAAEQTKITLPDASEVVLNAASTIEYNKTTWNKKREINLEGEAFFKVAKGKKFDVVTEKGKVSVLGTQFTVKRRGEFFEVKCFEGVVLVSTNQNSKKLRAGDTYRLINTNTSFGTTKDDSPQWIHQKSNFRAVPFSEVLLELERQYNISINTTNINKNRLFSGVFVHNNLKNALTSVTSPLGISYEIRGSNEVVLYE